MTQNARAATAAELAFASALLEHQVLAAYVLDRNGRVLLWNRACERLTGLAAATVLGTNEHWRAFGDTPVPGPADRLVGGANGGAEDVLVFEDGDGIGQGLYKTLHEEGWLQLPLTGASRFLARDACPVLDAQGTLLAALETLTDLSVQKAAEKQLLLLASRDGLTGLTSRPALEESMASEWNRAVRHGHPLSFIMANLDHFSAYNERFGRRKGDECLQAAAGVLRKEARRPGDVVARYEGSTFAVLLPHVDLSGAQAVAERIRAAVRSLPPLVAGEYLSMSLGAVSVVPWMEEGPEMLLSAAEQALGKAKVAGRDRVVAERADTL